MCQHRDVDVSPLFFLLGEVISVTLLIKMHVESKGTNK